MMSKLPLFILVGVALGACELSPKNIGDTGDTTGDTGGTEGSGGGSGTDSNSGGSGSGSGGNMLQCEDPLMFPGVGKECVVDEDCALVFHQTDCCGTLDAYGVSQASADAYNQTEAMCAAQFPACDCAQMPTDAEDGNSTQDNNAIVVQCVQNQCQSAIPEPGPLQLYTTCGDPACMGYTPPDGVPLCTPEQMEGALCDVEGATCDPMSDCNQLLVCATQDPKTQNPGGCPISRAKFKTDIEYLAPADLERHAADLRSLKLATYRYRAAPASDPPRLGIILEDNEQGIWVDGRHDRVDLYGYASLAVATLQVQQRQIAVLQAEIERLSAQVEGSRAWCGQ